MRLLPLLLAVAGTASALFGQATCSTQTGSSRSLPTNSPFSGNNLFGHPNYPATPPSTYDGFNFLMDVSTADA